MKFLPARNDKGIKRNSLKYRTDMSINWGVCISQHYCSGVTQRLTEAGQWLIVDSRL
jgi:hypothetical protein